MYVQCIVYGLLYLLEVGRGIWDRTGSRGRRDAERREKQTLPSWHSVQVYERGREGERERGREGERGEREGERERGRGGTDHQLNAVPVHEEVRVRSVH